MQKSILLVFTILFIFCLSQLLAQKIISGRILDGETGEPLPAANIQIEGTYTGTISNENGQFILKLDQTPARLKVSYIGYATEVRTITEESAGEQPIELRPISYQLDPIIVTGEDPAIRIMRRVIEEKKKWRAKLETYSAEAYTRIILENDTSVTSIMESISTAYWDIEKGSREIIRSKKQTSNIESQNNFANVSQITNLYDDNIELAGFDLIGVTHPDALDHYHFKLTGQRMRDQDTVFDIFATPKSKLQAGFTGSISVLDENL